MSLVLAWVVFPLIMTVLSLGLGLLVEEIARVRLPGVLVLPTGFAALVVVAEAATMSSATARFATPAVVTLATAGLLLSALSRPSWRKPDAWPAVSALGVFAAFGAPIVLSGSATFAGWIKLDDTATWLAITDRVMQHGRSLAGLPQSTYQLTLEAYVNTGYPVGSFVPLGVGGQLMRQDLAWLVQPYMAFLASMLALCVYGLASGIVTSRALRAVTAFVASQAALYYGYAAWGGVKEIAAAPLIALVAALVATLLRRDAAPRSAIPIAVATAATFGALTVGGGIWLAPILLPALWLVFRARGPRPALRMTAAFVVITAVLSIPTLAITGTFAHATSSSSVLTSGKELGNLYGPLKFVQVLGIWPTGDFRVNPHDLGPVYLLLALAVLAAVAGVVYGFLRRAPGLPLYLASALVGAIVLTLLGSPWIGAKALATASPALVAAALVGACALIEGGRRVEGVVLALAIAGGVLWSNVLAYHDVSLAPRAPLAELATIGNRFAGDGPALMTEYSPYGARHFLRQLDPESASEYRSRVIPLLSGKGLDKGGFADIDQFQTSGVLVYRTLVLRRSATASRPPSVYHLVWRGHFYQVWQRPAAGGPRILVHQPFGSSVDPTAVPPCNTILQLAKLAGPGGTLATVERPATIPVSLTAASLPLGWSAVASAPGAVLPSGKGSIATNVTVPRNGVYGLWLTGSFRDRLRVSVDSRPVFSGRNEQSFGGVYVPVGTARLRAGRHRLLARYDGHDLQPGSGGAQSAFGPLVLGTSTAATPVTYVSAADASSLCGKRLDWLEALAP